MAEQKFPEATVGALIFRPDGKMFLMKSHKWKDKYVVPGGHVELGETLEEALKREVKEETGMDIFGLEFISFQEFVFGNEFWKERHFLFFDFACKTKSAVVTLNSEGQDFTWTRPEVALKLPVEPYTRRAIREFMKRFPEGRS